jgi:hypothetical protein
MARGKGAARCGTLDASPGTMFSSTLGHCRPNHHEQRHGVSPTRAFNKLEPCRGVGGGGVRNSSNHHVLLPP